jgi:superfamily I DNA and/or RNA helicase
MFSINDNRDGSLISMTTNQIASLLKSAENKDLTFDYAIIDEASKCRFEDLIISLPKIKHLVLIGDFMQLDPMFENYANLDLTYQNLFDPESWENLNRSSFSLLLSQFVEHNDRFGIKSFDSNPYVAVMKRQYRMNKGIYNLIEPVYSIHDGFDLIDEKRASANDVKCINIHGSEMPSGTSQLNTDEAEAIISFMKEFKANRDKYPNIKTIGIITGYKAQENYIRRKLKNVRIKGVQLGTFDRFQGREYDLVIVSLVRTAKLGFTNNVRRMNVAFSRAKNHLLVFGNFDALNKIALRNTKQFDEEMSNTNKKEAEFVVQTLIPKLYSLREDFVSDAERVESIMEFLKENDYE